MWNDLKQRPIELEQFIKETENGERGRTSPWRNTHSLCFTFWESTGIQVCHDVIITNSTFSSTNWTCCYWVYRSQSKGNYFKVKGKLYRKIISLRYSHSIDRNSLDCRLQLLDLSLQLLDQNPQLVDRCPHLFDPFRHLTSLHSLQH